jgi:hypothetical protein
MPKHTKSGLKVASRRGPQPFLPATSQARKGKVTLELPVREPNIEAIRAFMNDCLVPLLAEEFLRSRQIDEEKPRFQRLGPKNLIPEPLVGRAASRVVP